MCSHGAAYNKLVIGGIRKTEVWHQYPDNVGKSMWRQNSHLLFRWCSSQTEEGSYNIICNYENTVDICPSLSADEK